VLQPAPGTRPEFTPVEDHYRIDINTRPPVVDGNEWRLRFSGLVDNALELTLDDLRNNYDAMPVRRWPASPAASPAT
jgi:DMSO/TMAO reductase YedYZ molybdopterin-dependent catalytic subunit